MSGQPSVDAEIELGTRAVLERWRADLAGGMPRAGWKIGINDPAALQRLGLAAPLVAPLDGRAVLASGETRAVLASSALRVEAEVAVRLGRDVNAGAGLDEARTSIAALAPAIELVDFSKPRQPLSAMLAGGIFHDSTVLGDPVALGDAPAPPNRMPEVFRDGEPVATGLPGRVPDDLAEVVQLVASTLGRYGETLQAGDWIICGSYIDPFEVAAGAVVEARFGELGMVKVTLAAADSRGA